MPHKIISVIIILAISHFSVAQTSGDKELFATFDSMLHKLFKPGGPGGTALVSRQGNVIYKKAFGMADLELNVPMQPDMIFRIGSITKQFTSVAILQLAEKGKLSLQDDIKKFIPDYPTQGYTITVEHLLTHTSGIKSYTGMPGFQSMMRKDMKPEEIIDVFKNEKMEFAPGSKWNYNNSGYILLGYIIEKVSGKAYEGYVTENLFMPAGMMHSAYGNESRIIKNRAKGYQKNKDMYENADYLSMTLPYAAGSLLSTVEDLWKWNQAIHSYKLLSKTFLEKAFAAYQLSNGKSTNYGYGWGVNPVQGSAAIEHGGGINGFLTDAIYLPAEDVFVAVFSNCTCNSPDNTVLKMAALTIHKPYNYKEIAIDAVAAREYAGVYETTEGEQRIIRAEKNKVTSQRGSGTPYRIIPFEKDKFFFETNDLITIQFSRDKSGKIEKLEYRSRTENNDWLKSSKPIPAEKTETKVDKTILMSYAGEYELMPGFTIQITVEDERIFAQATNQGKNEIFPQSESRFFLKVVDAQLEFFKGPDNKISHLVLYQGGQRMEGKKIK
ncbi:MAG TPA: serine hydrolase [Chitinophagaceae bacterium]|nr:serine hydrolase [Chitinophagaceae bacterium]